MPTADLVIWKSGIRFSALNSGSSAALELGWSWEWGAGAPRRSVIGIGLGAAGAGWRSRARAGKILRVRECRVDLGIAVRSSGEDDCLVVLMGSMHGILESICEAYE